MACKTSLRITLTHLPDRAILIVIMLSLWKIMNRREFLKSCAQRQKDLHFRIAFLQQQVVHPLTVLPGAVSAENPRISFSSTSTTWAGVMLALWALSITKRRISTNLQARQWSSQMPMQMLRTAPPHGPVSCPAGTARGMVFTPLVPQVEAPRSKGSLSR